MEEGSRCQRIQFPVLLRSIAFGESDGGSGDVRIRAAESGHKWNSLETVRRRAQEEVSCSAVDVATSSDRFACCDALQGEVVQVSFRVGPPLGVQIGATGRHERKPAAKLCICRSGSGDVAGDGGK